MRRSLDFLDIQILEALGIYGPRNISKLARKINLPTSTVHKRIQELKSHFSLYLQINTYHTLIGLKKAFAFFRAIPGHESLLLKSMKANEYWLYLTARYDKPESFYGIYGIPADHTVEFKEFLEEMERLEIAQRVDLFWSTSICTVNMTSNWYNCESEQWVFEWDKWVEDIEQQEHILPYTLLEPLSYPQKADKIDIIILKELEKNAECKLREIAKIVGTSLQTVKYHLEKHVIANGLIEGYLVLFPHFEEASDNYFFRFNFHNEKTMAKFALSLQGKPFVRNIGKILKKTALVALVYLPRKEFGGFKDTLSRLIRNGLLKSYDYAIDDSSRKQAQTIPYTMFRDKSWVYNHEAHMRRLRELAKR